MSSVYPLLNNSLLIELLQDNAEQKINEIVQKWEEPHRFYHSFDNHLRKLLDMIDNIKSEQIEDLEGVINDVAYYLDILRVIAVFHDVFYDPMSKQNEELSVQYFKRVCTNTIHPAYNIIVEAIEDTKYHQPRNPFSRAFCELDLFDLIHGSLKSILANEILLFKEYQFCDYSLYKEGRVKFLRKFVDDHTGKKLGRYHIIMSDLQAQIFEQYIEYIEHRVPHIGVYAGSFNPFHKGHLNILQKAEKVFDKVIIALGLNRVKDIVKVGDSQWRQKMIKDLLPYHQVEEFTGFLADYLRSKCEHSRITLIRGLRNGDDFSYELLQHRFLQDQFPSISVIWIPCDREYDYISSSAIRQIEWIDPKATLPYVVQSMRKD
jgi:pantetheine-phosphate adenylyltransferase